MEEFSFLTVSSISEGLYKEKGSKFLSFLHPVKSREEVAIILKEYKTTYYDARHVCFAFRLGLKGEDYRAYDDGEPGHTAGGPILNQLKSYEITNVLLVVVRYFGGTKLGVSGLITAYKEAAIDALSHTTICQEELKEEMKVEVDFAGIDSLMKLISKYRIVILNQEFQLKASYLLSIPKLHFEKFKLEV